LVTGAGQSDVETLPGPVKLSFFVDDEDDGVVPRTAAARR
jgi:hypothetical protein